MAGVANPALDNPVATIRTARKRERKNLGEFMRLPRIKEVKPSLATAHDRPFLQPKYQMRKGGHWLPRKRARRNPAFHRISAGRICVLLKPETKIGRASS